jgi:serine phosphatase RsbU (regulator of sigma subunit)
MELHLGIAKIKKYAVSESGDTLELIERPGGGISVVLVDGQRSGKGAKRISNKVAGKVVSLLAEGIRDGAAARAASDFLYNERAGKVTATLNILSIDLVSNSIVITRNNPAPVLISTPKGIQIIDTECQSIGTRRSTRPSIDEIPLKTGLTILAFTDGITNAGYKKGLSFDVREYFETLLENDSITAQGMADKILERALELDEGRPVDDVSVLVVRVSAPSNNQVRRLSMSIPFGQ